jgi:Protein of unknown function (DUF3379)
MNREEFQIILDAWRHGGEDATDPHFAEALEHARRDPDLAQWFDEARKFDAALAREMQATVRIPDRLRSEIIAGMKVSPSAPRWRRPAWIALAASIALLATVVVTQWTGRDALLPIQGRALETLAALGAGTVGFDESAATLAPLRAFLEERDAPFPDSLPATLAGLEALGCKTVESDGRRASVVCFRGANGTPVHLIVVRGEAGDRAAGAQPRYSERGGWRIATWDRGELTCMLVTQGTFDDLKAVL